MKLGWLKLRASPELKAAADEHPRRDRKEGNLSLNVQGSIHAKSMKKIRHHSPERLNGTG
jgi:hypothetical protein